MHVYACVYVYACVCVFARKCEKEGKRDEIDVTGGLRMSLILTRN